MFWAFGARQEDRFNFLVENFAVEEENGAKRLVPRRCGNVTLNSKMS